MVLHDQRSILTVCAPAADVAGVKDVTVALPRCRRGRRDRDVPAAAERDRTGPAPGQAPGSIRQALDELGTAMTA